MNQHDWVFIITIPLTPKEAREQLAGKTLWMRDISPRSSQVRDSILVCHTCEQAIKAELLDQPCPGEPNGYDVEGVPWWN